MSIAITAIVRPSPTLRIAQGLLCAAVLGCSALPAAPAVRVVLVLAALLGFAWQWRNVKPARIDISGVGQLRLTVYHETGTGQGMRLLPGSTLWSGLLLLRLRSDAGAVHWLAVLPDSATPDARRRLALAVRAIAAHDQSCFDGAGLAWPAAIWSTVRAPLAGPAAAREKKSANP